MTLCSRVSSLNVSLPLKPLCLVDFAGPIEYGPIFSREVGTGVVGTAGDVHGRLNLRGTVQFKVVWSLVLDEP